MNMPPKAMESATHFHLIHPLLPSCSPRLFSSPPHPHVPLLPDSSHSLFMSFPLPLLTFSSPPLLLSLSAPSPLHLPPPSLSGFLLQAAPSLPPSGVPRRRQVLPLAGSQEEQVSATLRQTGQVLPDLLVSPNLFT